MTKFEDGKQYRVAFRTKPEIAFTITFDRSKFKKDRFGFLMGYQTASNGKKYYCNLTEGEIESMRICEKDGRCHQRYKLFKANGSTGWVEEYLK